MYWAMAKRAPDSRGQIWPASSAFPRRPSPMARRYVGALGVGQPRPGPVVERLTGGVDGAGHVGLACLGDAEVRLLGRRVDDLDDVGGGRLDPRPPDEEPVVVADRCGGLLDGHGCALLVGRPAHAGRQAAGEFRSGLSVGRGRRPVPTSVVSRRDELPVHAAVRNCRGGPGTCPTTPAGHPAGTGSGPRNSMTM